MDIKLKKAELAKSLQVSRAAIDKAVKAGHLILTEDKLVDFSKTKNDTWLKGQVAKGRIFNLNNIHIKEKKKTEPKKIINHVKGIEKDFVFDDESDNNLGTKKLKAEIDWKKSQVRLNELKEEKIKGDLIPFIDVQVLFTHSVETLRTTFNQNQNSIAEIFHQKAGLSHPELIELKKELTLNNNKIVMTFRKNLTKGINKIVKENSEVKEQEKGEEK